MTDEPKFGIVIHGGAGTITRSNLSAQREAEIRKVLRQALEAGWSVLESGGSSVDATVAAVVVMEDSAHFNAGLGAVYTSTETHELDASIMDGSTLNAGAVSGVRTVKNPITLARLVMSNSPHVMLSGTGAEEYATENDLDVVSNDYFDTEHRLKQLHRTKEQQRATGHIDPLKFENKFGTVGAVALDKKGNLSAATSTGGTTNKKYGRIGDSPIIGAGTYADNSSCAVSATGHGEYFIRHVVAHDICARMKYQDIDLAQAADDVVMIKLVKDNGSGGVIAMDKRGNIAMPFNSEGMYRGHRSSDSDYVIKIYRDK